ncbi:hypothetical protein [Cellulomonas carbonis]|nr:hypothetical protein [Cellulomonas carbonis]GGC10815.1 hypothetical protein GCM10010972_25170 [Cellulomonas carbonis]
MTPVEASDTIDRLVADLARATGRPETLVRLSYGIERPLARSAHEEDAA